MEKLPFPENWRQKLAIKLSELTADEFSKVYQEKQDKKEASEYEWEIQNRLRNTARQKVVEAVCRDDVLQSILPDASETERELFKSSIDYHLPTLLSDIEIPSYMDFCRISRVRRALTAAVGALYGGFLGWVVFALILHEGMSGMLFGAALVSGIVTYLMESAHLSTFLKTLSAATFLLTFRSLFSRSPFSFLNPTKKFLSALLWLFLILFPWLINPVGSFDKRFCLQWMERLFESWLAGIESAVLAVMNDEIEKVTEPMQDKQDEISARKNLNLLAEVCFSSSTASDEDRKLLLNELTDILKTAGYSSPVGESVLETGDGLSIQQNKRTMIWCLELEKAYERFDLIREGDEVIVEKEPLLQHGNVQSRGLVRKLRKGKVS